MRRLLVAGITRGLADAMRDNGATGTDEELATRACADIVCSLAHAGRGDEVLKLFAQIAPKGDGDDPKGDGRTPLDRALMSMPSAPAVPDQSRTLEVNPAYPDNSTAYYPGPTDYQSDARPSAARLGVSQLPLLSAAGGPGSLRPGAIVPAAGATPPPPRGATPAPSLPVDAAGLEKNEFENSARGGALSDQVRAGGQ